MHGAGRVKKELQKKPVLKNVRSFSKSSAQCCIRYNIWLVQKNQKNNKKNYV